MLPLKANLTAEQRTELDRVAAIASANRLASETAFYNSLSAYYGNEVLESDSSGNALEMRANAIPADGDTGYAKGCKLIYTSAADGVENTYVNVGSATSCQFLLEDSKAEETTTTLTSAQILLLNTTPIAITPTPATGKYIEILSITAKLTFNTIAYTGSNALEFRYQNGSGAKVSADLASTFLDASATAYRIMKPVVTELTPVLAQPVVAVVPTANPAAGNSTITLVVRYIIR